MTAAARRPFSNLGFIGTETVTQSARPTGMTGTTDPKTETAEAPAPRDWATVVGVVALLVLAALGVGAYFLRAPAQSTISGGYGPAVIPGPAQMVTASGGVNGPGGCSAPTGSGTEYCASVPLMDAAGSLLLEPLDGVVSPSTADLKIELQAPGSSFASLYFVNATLLSNSSGRILATYVPGVGWSGYGLTTLPVALASGQMVVLNGGLVSLSGDTLWFNEGHWGGASAAIP